MRIMLLALILIGLNACGEDPAKSPLQFKGEPKLIAYAEQFVRDAEERGRDFTGRFDYPIGLYFGATKDAKNPNRVGYCNPNGARYIVIDETFFDRENDATKEALIYHELGHCVLSRGHTDGCRDADGLVQSVIQVYHELLGVWGVESCPFPTSIMYPMLSMKDYEENREYYLQELFSEAH